LKVESYKVESEEKKSWQLAVGSPERTVRYGRAVGKKENKKK